MVEEERTVNGSITAESLDLRTMPAPAVAHIVAVRCSYQKTGQGANVTTAFFLLCAIHGLAGRAATLEVARMSLQRFPTGQPQGLRSYGGENAVASL
jgi:hypothetical protein